MWRLAACWLAAALRGRRGLAALDVGCGTGLTAVRLARLESIGSVVGLDPSPYALAHARERHGFSLVRASALDLPLESGRFDVATCFDVFQHLEPGGDRRAAREIARVLRPGGVAVVRTTARARGTPGGSEGGYARGDLAAVLEAAGLAVERSSYANCLPALVQEVRGRLRRDPRGGHPAGGGLKIRLPHPGVNRLMHAVASAEAVLAGRLAVPLPYGHSTLVLARRAA
jgi:SAM-dependent methyltransferase